MKGVIFPGLGAEPQVVDNLTKPEPADDQVLVKSLWTAINPVDTIISAAGLLVDEWPVGLGVDAGGVVVAAGSTAASKYNLKPGTYVCGCTRLSSPGYATCQEYFLMDAAVTMPKPSTVSVMESATLGVSSYTAALGLFDGLHVPLPDPASLPAAKDEYLLVLGGGSNVGKVAIQLAQACGYKVLASGSAKSKDTIAELGAESFDYKLSLEEQVKAVLDITGGNFTRIFDAVAEDDPLLAKALFKEIKGADKYFATTNNWGGITDFEGGKTHEVKLGEVGRPNATKLNTSLESYIPVIVALAEAGRVKPNAVDVVGGEEGGFESAIEAFKYQQAGKGGSKKVVVKIGDE